MDSKAKNKPVVITFERFKQFEKLISTAEDVLEYGGKVDKKKLREAIDILLDDNYQRDTFNGLNVYGEITKPEAK